MTKILRLVVITIGLLVALLPNGKVLVADGRSGSAVKSAELYDPTTGTWSSTGSMSFERDAFMATLLSTGSTGNT